MFGYIYKIINNINSKPYVGKHKYDKPILDESYITSGVLIKNAINKYGLENFTIELVHIADTPEELNELEKYYIKYFNSKYPNGYNLTDGGDGISNPSPEIIEKNRQKHLGIKQSEETKQKRNEKLKQVVHTKEWVEKIRIANKGVKPSQKTIEASSKRHKNTHWYNNGKIECMLFEDDLIPEGFIRGRLKNYFPNSLGTVKSQETKDKISKTKKKQKWYNNGITEKMIDITKEIPEGYIPGRLKKV